MSSTKHCEDIKPKRVSKKKPDRKVKAYKKTSNDKQPSPITLHGKTQKRSTRGNRRSLKERLVKRLRAQNPRQAARHGFGISVEGIEANSVQNMSTGGGAGFVNNGELQSNGSNFIDNSRQTNYLDMDESESAPDQADDLHVDEDGDHEMEQPNDPPSP